MSLARIWLAAAPLILLLAGCGAGDLGEGELQSVSGLVVYEGKPLPEGELAFHPDAEKGNSSRYVPRGAIGPDGTYTLSTASVPGAVPGWYRVAVVATRDGKPPRGAEGAMEPGTPWPVSIIPTRYSDPAKSGLSIEVVASPSADAYTLVLTK